MSIEALVTLRGTDAPAMGRDRVRLLEAVARHGSITAAAKAVGLSYKAAWDALDSMANLFGQPLVTGRAGGKSGGGTGLTPSGMRIVQAFHRLEGEMARVMRSIAPDLDGTGLSPLNLVSGFFMRTSARNALRGLVTKLVSDALTTEVAVTVEADITIQALITNESLRDLGLFVGRDAIVLIKAPFVIIAPGTEPPSLSVRNCLRGVVARCETSAVAAEVVLDIGGGKTIAATISAHSAKTLDLSPGKPAFALFDAAHVIVAVD